MEVWVQAANPHESIRPGGSARLEIIAETVSDALVIPAVALLTAPDESTSVMVVDAQNKPQQKAVKVGIHDGWVPVPIRTVIWLFCTPDSRRCSTRGVKIAFFGVGRAPSSTMMTIFFLSLTSRLRGGVPMGLAIESRNSSEMDLFVFSGFSTACFITSQDSGS